MPLMTINDYLNNIYTDFEPYALDQTHTLCKLREIDFTKGHIPDYSDIHVQQYYLLRYAYGYAFEYKRVYQDLFKYFWSPDGPVCKVTSIGCGTMLDYWALARVLESVSRQDISIDYTGLDLVDWNYRMPAREGDSVRFLQADAIQELSSRTELDSKFYFFPKSISEFRYEKLDQLCSIFRSKPIKEDKIYLLFTIRKENKNKGSYRVSSQDVDLQNIGKLRQAVAANGYRPSISSIPLSQVPVDWDALKAAGKKPSITSIDPDFPIFHDAVDLITTLYDRCNRSLIPACPYSDCRTELNFHPILNYTEARWVILPYERS